MSLKFDLDNYSTILFFDSMLILEGRPLTELPWKEIDAGGNILLVAVRQVVKEIDAHKRDGRVGTRARKFNQIMRPVACSNLPTRIIDKERYVDLWIAPHKPIVWDNYPEFDPSLGDDVVIAQVLNVQDIPPPRKRFISQDINPISLGAQIGLDVIQLGEHWLLGPEASPHDKELAKVKRRLEELESSEPNLETVS